LLEIIKSLFGSKPAAHRVSPYPVMRNIVLDIMAEGRRKNTIHMPFDADATAILDQLHEINAERKQKITLTSYIAKALADTVAADTRLQAYRNTRGQLVMFDDVDLSVMIERKVDGVRMPIPHIVRAVNKLALAPLNDNLVTAQRAPLYSDAGPLSKLEAQFFTMPRFIRKLVWFFIRRDPHLFREVAGTVGLTSLPAYLSHRAAGTPISPMTLTLLVGAISPQLVMINGEVREKKIIQMNLAADHDVVDGAQMMHFLIDFRARLSRGSPS